MQCILAGLLMLLVCAVFAGDEAYIAHVEAEALLRAQSFSAEIKQINQGILASRQSGQIAHYSQEVKNAFKSQEPLATHLNKVSQTLVFLSFSMPEKSILQWLFQCQKSGATPVIRGLMNNSFKDTMTAIQRLSKKTGTGLQLDPVLFQAFAINQVPAVVFIRETPACPANMNCLPARYDSLYGDVSLEYALEKFNEGETHPNLLHMIHQLKTVGGR